MFNNLSLKIGLLFLVFIFIIESFLFFILYTNLVNTRVDEVMESLLARGNTHRDVLEDHFDASTIDHVVIMESESEFSVVITDRPDNPVQSSKDTNEAMLDIIAEADAHKNITSDGIVIKDNSTEEEFVATDSPMTINNAHAGHVYMFAQTSYVERVVDQLAKQFFITGIITIILTIKIGRAHV